MGLDMYAYRVKPHPENTQFSFEGEKEDLAYWRKFNALHGWMEKLYNGLGGEDQFNCIPLRLTPEIIDALEKDIEHLSPIPGFFFGPQEYTEDDKDEVRNFISNCRGIFASGDEVYYVSWW